MIEKSAANTSMTIRIDDLRANGDGVETLIIEAL